VEGRISMYITALFICDFVGDHGILATIVQVIHLREDIIIGRQYT
jgi:hypothetical protein